MPTTEPVNQISQVFLNTYKKINFPLENQTSQLLATDLLRSSTKRQLLKIVLIHVEQNFLAVLENKIPFQEKVQSQSIFTNIVIQSSESFLTKTYGLNFLLSPTSVENSLYFKTACEDSDILISATFSALLNSCLLVTTFILSGYF